VQRFEYVEGKSSKFWEIEVDGTDLTVRFGRIGTNGQTKTRTFGSADAATKERDKLVREKTDKGYREVSVTAGARLVAAAVTSTSSATGVEVAEEMAGEAEARAETAALPAEADDVVTVGVQASAARHELDALPEGGILWSPELRRKVLARRDFNPRPIEVDVYAAWSEVRKCQVGTGEAHIATTDADLLRAVEAVKRMHGSAAPPVTDAPALHGVLLAWLALEFRNRERRDVVVDYWVGAGGLPFAIAALAAGATCDLAPGSYWGQFNEKWGASQDAAFVRLREHLAGCDAAAYDAARTAAARLRPTLPLAFRALIDFLFPSESQWAEETAREALATAGLDLGAPFLDLLTCIADPALSRSLAAKAHGQYYVGTEPVALSMLAAAGAAAAPAVAVLLDRTPGPSDVRRALARALSIVARPEAVQYLAQHADNKDLLSAASEAVMRWPALALEPLAGVAARSRGSAAATLLGSLLRANPQLAERVDALPEASRAIVRAMLEKFRGPEVEAAAQALPAVLVSPPWLRGGRRKQLVSVADLPAVALADAMCWGEGERERWLGKEQAPPRGRARTVEDILGRLDIPVGAQVLAERDDAQAIEAMREAMQRKAHWSWHAIADLNELPPRLAAHIWNAPTTHHWYDYQGHALRRLAAQLELSGLPGLLRHAASNAEDGFDALIPFRSPRIAAAAAHAYHNTKKGRAPAQRWLLAHPQAAAVGVLPLALGKPSKERDSAAAVVRLLRDSGHETLLRDVAKRYGTAAEHGLDALLEFDPLDLYPSKLPKLPAFWTPGAFARPLLKDGGAALPLPAVEHLGTMLAISTPDAPYAGLALVKEAATPPSLAAFAWDLFCAWSMAGSPSKEQWAFNALGILGDDECARRLAPLIRNWPGEAAHARAVMGLDVLANIGTDVALMHLHAISQKVKFKGLKERAQEKIEQIAQARGLTAEELGDRLVPDLGLDEDGSLTLDFGPRSFRVGFNEQLKPFVRDASGKPVADLPKPAKSDDAQKAAASVETYKALKKDARAIASQQITRLELAMCARRRWDAQVFRTFLVEHPLVGHLARRLLWGLYGADNQLVTAFRVAEDRTFADQHDNTWELPAGAQIGLVHALDLPEPLANAFGQVFGDYEILQPFRQLGRDTYRLTPEEQKAAQLTRFQGLKVQTVRVVGLESRGWRRGDAQDAGSVWWMLKPLAKGEQIVLGFEPGFIVGDLSFEPEQTLGVVTIEAEGSWDQKGSKPLGALDAVVASELLRDLESLRG
jgi:predicted DNA-binding WGR domain protein